MLTRRRLGEECPACQRQGKLSSLADLQSPHMATSASYKINQNLHQICNKPIKIMTLENNRRQIKNQSTRSTWGAAHDGLEPLLELLDDVF